MVAAMIILLLCGTALSEVFGSQVRLSALEVEASRAAWIAEAGLWHAGGQAAAVPTAVSFQGGAYTVTMDGNDFVATAILESATRVTPLTMAVLASPLDEVATAATARRISNDKIELDLISIAKSDVVLEAFQLSVHDSSVPFEKMDLSGKSIWQESSPPPLPFGVTVVNKGTTLEATVPAGGAPTLTIQTKGKPVGVVGYTLTLHFQDSSSSSLRYSIAW